MLLVLVIVLVLVLLVLVLILLQLVIAPVLLLLGLTLVLVLLILLELVIVLVLPLLILVQLVLAQILKHSTYIKDPVELKSASFSFNRMVLVLHSYPKYVTEELAILMVGFMDLFPFLGSMKPTG